MQGGLLVLRALSPASAWAVIGTLLVASTALTLAFGGTSSVAPLWFFVPIILAATRFGVGASLATAAAAGFLAGPGVPARVATGEMEALGLWGSRGLGFLGVGVLIAWLVEDAATAASEELAVLRREHELLEAINDHQLRLHYQPVVLLADRSIIGVEALARWEHPTRGLLPAAEFIPLAERSSLVAVLGAWVLEEACRQAAEWHRTILGESADFGIAVNVSGVQLGRAELADEVVRVLADTGLAPSSLCLEVTETTLVDDIERSIEGLLGLRMLGVHVAVDDFGTGYSSLVYLRRLPVDVVKIDRRFVHGMATDPDDAAIVSAVISLAHSLGKTALAEGVEREEEADALRVGGCDQAQGYLFGAPVPPERLAELLAAQVATRRRHGSHARRGGDVGP